MYISVRYMYSELHLSGTHGYLLVKADEAESVDVPDAAVIDAATLVSPSFVEEPVNKHTTIKSKVIMFKKVFFFDNTNK